MADTISKKAPEPTGYQFGTFKGVFTPSILTILGVIMYLRFGWALACVELGPTILIITIASGITFLTGLSLAALATNMKVKGGGAYYIISRSLGVEAGAAVGLPLFLAQALGISFYAAGFSESLVSAYPDLVPRAATAMGLSVEMVAAATAHAPQVIGVITLLALAAVAYKSADLALKSQFVIMGIITLSLGSLFLGSDPAASATAANSIPLTKSFWGVFAIIFPAVTGIEAGIAMSGDLKDPAKSLPRGTILAVVSGYVAYIAIVVFLWFMVTNKELLADPMIMSRVARVGSLVLFGVFAASLSSAMGALLGAPRTLQALARDRVVPAVLGRGYGKGNDPRLATAVAFLVGLTGVLLGDLNAIAQVLSMFFLTSYGLLNVSACLEELTSPPSWRPKFRVPWPVSLIGALGCFAAMFMINAGATFIAAFVALAVYLLMERRHLKAWWGDMRSGLLMLIARNAIHALSKRPPDERTWKPNILVLSGSPTTRWYLIELAHAISRDSGFLTVAAIVPTETPQDRVESMSQGVRDYLEKREVAAIVRVLPAASPIAGARLLARTYGYGPITPNTLLLGETEQRENYKPFARLVETVCHQRQNLVIIRESDAPHEPGEHKQIDIWWYGTQQNLGLMLALVHLLRRSQGWRGAILVLKSIVNTPEEQEGTLKRLESFIEKVRIQAHAEVLIKTSDDVFSTIRRHSHDADLVFLGMRAPSEDETLDAYSEYYGKLLTETEGLPPVALVLASEQMDFYSIFREP